MYSRSCFDRGAMLVCFLSVHNGISTCLRLPRACTAFRVSRYIISHAAASAADDGHGTGDDGNAVKSEDDHDDDADDDDDEGDDNDDCYNY